MTGAGSEGGRPPLPAAESAEQSIARQKFRKFLKPFGKNPDEAKQINRMLFDEQQRTIYTEEWASSIRSAKDYREVRSLINVGYDPHQAHGENVDIIPVLKERLSRLNPPARENYEYDINTPTQLLPEYDVVRQALAEKLEQFSENDFLQLRNSLTPLVVTSFRGLPQDKLIKALRIPHQPQVATQPPTQPVAAETTKTPNSDKEKDLQELKRSIDTLLSYKIGRAVVSSKGRRVAYLCHFPPNTFGISEDGALFTMTAALKAGDPASTYNDFLRSAEDWKLQDDMTPEVFRDWLSRTQHGVPLQIEDRTDSADSASALRVFSVWNLKIKDGLVTRLNEHKREAEKNKRVEEGLRMVASDFHAMLKE